MNTEYDSGVWSRVDDLDIPDNPISIARFLRGLLEKWTNGPDRSEAYAAAGVEDFETYLAAVIGDLRVDIAAIVERLNHDAERTQVMLNLCEQFRQEAMVERRKMLGDAGIAVAMSELDTREVARVVRALALLDPEDLSLLRRVSDLQLTEEETADFEKRDGRSSAYVDCAKRVYLLSRGHYAGANLVGAGCVVHIPHVHRFSGPVDGITTSDSVHESVEVTPVGELVLRFMGHEVRDDTAST